MFDLVSTLKSSIDQILNVEEHISHADKSKPLHDKKKSKKIKYSDRSRANGLSLNSAGRRFS